MKQELVLATNSISALKVKCIHVHVFKMSTDADSIVQVLLVAASWS